VLKDSLLKDISIILVRLASVLGKNLAYRAISFPSLKVYSLLVDCNRGIVKSLGALPTLLVSRHPLMSLKPYRSLTKNGVV